MSKRVLCKFFANGACLKGEHCEYSHSWTSPPNNICTFYQKGLCAYGSRCRYQHVKASRSQSQPGGSSSATRSSSNGTTSDQSASTTSLVLPKQPVWKPVGEDFDAEDSSEISELRSVRPSDRAICSFAAAGNCPRGEKCPHIHGDLCPTCGKHCLHPFRPEEREEHVKACEKKQMQIEALKRSQEIECSVCLERVLSKPNASERKFGLLSECDHPFCVSCIRNWRSSSPRSGYEALRSCPVCRKLSYFVIPSVIWYTTKEEKEEIIESYKSKLLSIDCKHFDFGNGNCPFGTSCFYKHTIKRDSYIWKYHKPPPRRQIRSRPNDAVHMDGIIEFSRYLEDLENFNPEDLDDEDISELSSFQTVLMFSRMGFEDTSDSSSDEEFFTVAGQD